MARAAAVRPAVATFWIAVLALAQTSPRAASAQPEQQTIVTGQQLADAVAAYGRRNADTTLLVPANTTLRLANATFTSVPDAEAAGGKAFSSGVLTIEGAGSTSTVLDAGMRFGAWGGCQPRRAAQNSQRSHSISQACKGITEPMHVIA